MMTTRDVTREIAIAAPVDAVWKALTDAAELMRWFPPMATVEPGPGGRLRRAWQTGEAIEERIDRWVPGEHLRTVGLTGAWKGIITDYRLTTQGGVTTIRVVSSVYGLPDERVRRIEREWQASLDTALARCAIDDVIPGSGARGDM